MLLLGIFKSMDQRFKWLLNRLSDGALLISSNQKNDKVDELVIPGINTFGGVLNSCFTLSDFLAINQIKRIYTLSEGNNLHELALFYHVEIISLNDEIYQRVFLNHKLLLIKYLCYLHKINLSKKRIGVSKNDELAQKSGLTPINKLESYEVIINCDLAFFDNHYVKNKIIFDLTENKYGFLELWLKDKGIAFFAINQYVGQLLTKTGAKIIYDSLVRNRVNH